MLHRLTIGATIKAERLKRKLTLRALATKAELNHVTIWQWETGKCEPSLMGIVRVAQAMDMSVVDLIFPYSLPKHL